MFRHGSYDEKLAAKLRKSQKFARGFLLTLMEGEDGLSPIDALKHTIHKMGVREFSKMSGIPEKSISRMLGSKEVPKLDTLDRYFAPFGLKVKIDLEDVA